MIDLSLPLSLRFLSCISYLPWLKTVFSVHLEAFESQVSTTKDTDDTKSRTERNSRIRTMETRL